MAAPMAAPGRSGRVILKTVKLFATWRHATQEKEAASKYRQSRFCGSCFSRK
jgi:hypothetical protein